MEDKACHAPDASTHKHNKGRREGSEEVGVVAVQRQSLPKHTPTGPVRPDAQADLILDGEVFISP